MLNFNVSNILEFLFSYHPPPNILSQGSELQYPVFRTSLISTENTSLMVSVIMFWWLVIISVWCDKYVIQIMDDSKKYQKWLNGSVEMTKLVTQE